ncbi:hypothetical protein ACS0TY_023364 [Phlomoides rotata]
MLQVPSYYQDWRNDEAPPTFEEPWFDYSSPPLDVHYGQGYYPQNGYGIQGNSERVYYNNEIGFEYDYQMPQASSHYQEWGNNEDWSHASPMNDFQPQHDFQPNQDYDAPIYSSPIEELPIDEMFALVLDKMENLDARGVEEMREYLKKKMEDTRGEEIFDKMKKYVEVMNQHLEDLSVKRR